MKITLDEVLEKIRDPQTRALRLTHFDFSVEDFAAIAEALPGSNVTSIFIYGSAEGPEGNTIHDKNLAPLLEALPQTGITSLETRNCSFGDATLNRLARILPHAPLTTLKTGFSEDATAEAYKNFFDAWPKSQLTEYDSNVSYKMPLEAIYALAEALKRSHITSFSDYSNFSHAGLMTAAIAKILPDSPLQELHLHSSGVYKEAAEALGEALPRSQLTALTINPLCSEGTHPIAQGAANSKLKALTLGDELGVEGCRTLANALPTSDLRQLYVNAQNCEGATLLAKALPGTKLEYFSVGGGFLTEEFSDALAKSLPASNLRRLTLGPCLELAPIMAAIGESQLEALYLRNGHTQENDLALLAASIPVGKLHELYFNNCNIAADYLAELPDLIRNGNLHTLSIYNPLDGTLYLDAVHLEELASALRTSGLTYLDITGCRFDEQGFEALRDAITGSQLVALHAYKGRGASDEAIEHVQAHVSAHHKKALTLAKKIWSPNQEFTAEEWHDISSNVDSIHRLIRTTGATPDGKSTTEEAAQNAMRRAIDAAFQRGFPCHQFAARAFPLEQAMEIMAEKGEPLRASHLLNQDNTAPTDRPLCIGGARALFAQPDLWESAAQIRKAFRSLPETQRDSIHNMQTLTAKVASRGTARASGGPSL